MKAKNIVPAARTRRVIQWADGKWWGVEVNPIDGSYFPLTFGHATAAEAKAILDAAPVVTGVDSLRKTIFDNAIKDIDPAGFKPTVLDPASIAGPTILKAPHPLASDLIRTPALMVYGTLRAEERATDFMLDASGGIPFATVLLAGYDLFGFGIPGIRPTKRGDKCKGVVGEVYRLSDPERLARLDDYEGAYDRTLVRPKVTGPLLGSVIPKGLIGAEIDAWVYVYQRDHGDLIPHGDWVKHVKTEGAWPKRDDGYDDEDFRA